MTTANAFVKALQKATSGDVETVAQARARHQTEWLEDLGALVKQVSEWLAPVVEAKLLTIVEREYEVTEADTGVYLAPGLELELLVAGETRRVKVRPRGMRIPGAIVEGPSRIVGASGRVDIESGVSREILLRFKDADEVTWLSFAGGEKKTLTEDVFFALLAKVSGVELG